MFVKRSETPRTATLPDGSILSLADLPPLNSRWVARRKETVVYAVAYGLLTRDEALRRYDLSEEEFDAWVKAIRRHGRGALKVTSLQRYR